MSNMNEIEEAIAEIIKEAVTSSKLSGGEIIHIVASRGKDGALRNGLNAFHDIDLITSSDELIGICSVDDRHIFPPPMDLLNERGEREKRFFRDLRAIAVRKRRELSQKKAIPEDMHIEYAFFTHESADLGTSEAYPTIGCSIGLMDIAHRPDIMIMGSQDEVNLGKILMYFVEHALRVKSFIQPKAYPVMQNSLGWKAHFSVPKVKHVSFADLCVKIEDVSPELCTSIRYLSGDYYGHDPIMQHLIISDEYGLFPGDNGYTPLIRNQEIKNAWI